MYNPVSFVTHLCPCNSLCNTEKIFSETEYWSSVVCLWGAEKHVSLKNVNQTMGVQLNGRKAGCRWGGDGGGEEWGREKRR